MKGLWASAFTTWLALIALQALASKGSAGRVSEFFSDVDQLLERALDPTVPAIPDLRAGAGPARVARAGESRSSFPPRSTTTPRLPIPGGTLPV